MLVITLKHKKNRRTNMTMNVSEIKP